MWFLERLFTQGFSEDDGVADTNHRLKEEPEDENPPQRQGHALSARFAC